jgi:hypothetical protein
MRGFISLGDSSPGQYRRTRGRSRWTLWRRCIGYDNGTYLVLSTDYGKRLCSGRGYLYRKPLRARVIESTMLVLRLGVLLALSLAVPAQAHGAHSNTSESVVAR